MSRTVQKLLRLSRRDRGLLVSAAWNLAVSWLALRLFSFKRLQAVAVARASRREEETDFISSVVWAVEAVAWRFGPFHNCLVKSLAGQRVLAKRGRHSQVRIGVAKDGRRERLDAHAWLELDGRVILGEAREQPFVPLSGRPVEAGPGFEESTRR